MRRQAHTRRRLSLLAAFSVSVRSFRSLSVVPTLRRRPSPPPCFCCPRLTGATAAQRTGKPTGARKRKTSERPHATRSQSHRRGRSSPFRALPACPDWSFLLLCSLLCPSSGRRAIAHGRTVSVRDPRGHKGQRGMAGGQSAEQRPPQGNNQQAAVTREKPRGGAEGSALGDRPSCRRSGCNWARFDIACLPLCSSLTRARVRWPSPCVRLGTPWPRQTSTRLTFSSAVCCVVPQFPLPPSAVRPLPPCPTAAAAEPPPPPTCLLPP
jgi:hypothetical protein